MKPSKEIEDQRDRDLDLKRIWERLGKEPPGPIVDERPHPLP
jgi:hypothetical protein